MPSNLGSPGRGRCLAPRAFSCLLCLLAFPEPSGSLPGGCAELRTQTGRMQVQPCHFLGVSH